MDDGLIDGPEAMRDFLNLMGSEPEISAVPVLIDSSTVSYTHLDVYKRQEQQLCLDDIGRIVVNRSPQKDDAIHHQTRKDVHRRHVQLALDVYKRQPRKIQSEGHFARNLLEHHIKAGQA